MASKVEEYRDKTIEIIKEFSGGGIAGEIIDLIDWTISAAHAEGVAEGAEQMKDDVRRASMHYGDGEEIEGSDAETVEGDVAVAQYEMYITPASVLAPTKEEP